MRDYNKLLEAGNKAQLEKLEQNGHKKGFDNISIAYAYGRLQQENKELTDVLMSHPWLDFSDNTPEYIKAVRAEAADIANFAHMIILACDKELLNG